MFAVNHWQLEQSGCLANDAVLCSMAALPAAAGTACPGNLGAAGLGSAGLLLQMVALAWSVWCWKQSGLLKGCAAGAGGCTCPLSRWNRQVTPGTLPPAIKASQFPLQSLQHSVHGAWSMEHGGRTELPQPELQRKSRARAFAAGTLSGREEQG